jgi:GntR family transcriptional regulator
MAKLSNRIRTKTADKAVEPATLHQKTEQRLREYLTSGRIATGEKLPPEVELCDLMNVSRNTLRTALSRLEGEGYILRRKRQGTVVLRTTSPRRFSVDLSSIETIRNYLRRTNFADRVVGRRKIPAAIQNTFGFAAQQQWVLISGVRREIGTDKIIAGVDLYLDPGYEAEGEAFGRASDIFYEIIEKRHGEKVFRVDMNILPLALPRRWAESFGEPEGTPTLGLVEVVRKSDGFPIEVFSIVFAPSVQVSVGFVPDRINR